MKLNADLSQRALVYSTEIPWVDSPSPGVQRRMLDRDGDEVARATTIVRFAPNSYFPAHIYEGGEEFLVLEGVFSDEHGDYGPGSYLRNPVGSEHTPYSKEGTTILVKLWQMNPNDQDYVAIDTNTATWKPGMVVGQQLLSLHAYGNERVMLQRLKPGTILEKQTYPGGMEIFVLDGVLEDEFGRYTKGAWLRNPAGSSHTPFTKEECLIYIKTGHLKTEL